MRDFRQCITNQNGVTLIQVIITLALVGVMSMMLMRMTTILQKNRTSLEKNVEVDFFMKKMGSHLISKDSCYSSFKDMVLDLDVPVDVPAIVDGSGNALVDIASQIGTAVGSTHRNSTNIASITITRIASAEARLSFRFDRGDNGNGARNYFGARRFNKNIPIILNINPADNTVEGCYGDINNSLEASCDKLGGEFDPIAGTCLIFDLAYNQHSSQQCEAIGGTVVEEIDGTDRFKFCRLPYTQYEVVKGWTQYKNYSATNTDPVPSAGTECLPPIAADTVKKRFFLTSNSERDETQLGLTDYNNGNQQWEPARGPILYNPCVPASGHSFDDIPIEECTTNPIAGYPECTRTVNANTTLIGAY